MDRSELKDDLSRARSAGRETTLATERELKVAEAEQAALLKVAKKANNRAVAAESKLERLTGAARDRLPKGCNDTCQSQLGDYPCNCGQDALRAALAGEGEK